MPSPSGAERDRVAVQDVVGEPVDDLRRRAGGGHVRRRGRAQRFGADVPASATPSGPVRPGRGSARRPCSNQARVRSRGRCRLRGEAPGGSSPRMAESSPRTWTACACQAARCSAEAAGFVLGFAGFQGGLLGERDRLDRGRRASVVAAGRRWRVRLAGRRSGAVATTSGPAARVDPDDLPDRTLAAGRRRCGVRSGRRRWRLRWASRAVL